MKKLITAVAALVSLAAAPALAQEQEQARKLRLSPYAGAFIATGEQRDVLDDALLTGLTLSYDLTPYLAVVGSFGWAGSQGQQALTLDEDLDVFQYDVGVQGQYPLLLGHGLTLKPFVGAGLGARTYDFRDLDVDAETDLAGYLSLGANLEYRRLVLGVTMRDYVSAYDGIATDEDSTARNDISLFTSIGARF